VSGRRAEPEPVRVHPLDVDRGERRAELPRHLVRDGDTAARQSQHDDVVASRIRLQPICECSAGLASISKRLPVIGSRIHERIQR
jgi:hypothetical protein